MIQEGTCVILQLSCKIFILHALLHFLCDCIEIAEWIFSLYKYRQCNFNSFSRYNTMFLHYSVPRVKSVSSSSSFDNYRISYLPFLYHTLVSRSESNSVPACLKFPQAWWLNSSLFGIPVIVLRAFSLLKPEYLVHLDNRHMYRNIQTATGLHNEELNIFKPSSNFTYDRV